MTDIAIQWDNVNGYGDWTFANGDLTTTHGLGDLENVVALCLFSDARCPDSFVPPDGDRRGWWADSFTSQPLGSQLWMLERAKKNGETQLLLRARDYAKAALQWLVDEGIVAAIEVKTRWLSPTAIGIQVAVTEPQQSLRKVYDYSWAWSVSRTV